MRKVEILKTLLLLGIVCTLVTFHFYYYDNDNISKMNYYIYGSETLFYGEYPDYAYNETVKLMPPDWLLELHNISLNESFVP